MCLNSNEAGVLCSNCLTLLLRSGQLRDAGVIGGASLKCAFAADSLRSFTSQTTGKHRSSHLHQCSWLLHGSLTGHCLLPWFSGVIKAHGHMYMKEDADTSLQTGYVFRPRKKKHQVNILRDQNQ